MILNFRGRKLFISVLKKEKVVGCALSLTEEGLKRNVLNLTKFLRARGVKKLSECSDFDEVIEKVLFGKMENSEALKYLDFSFVTPFERKVYIFVSSIPYGATMTYSEVARCIGTSARGVARALSLNPFPPIVPCHRVVARDGLGGYSQGVKVKKLLLYLESFF